MNGSRRWRPVVISSAIGPLVDITLTLADGGRSQVLRVGHTSTTGAVTVAERRI